MGFGGLLSLILHMTAGLADLERLSFSLGSPGGLKPKLTISEYVCLIWKCTRGRGVTTIYTGTGCAMFGGLYQTENKYRVAFWVRLQIERKFGVSFLV